MRGQDKDAKPPYFRADGVVLVNSHSIDQHHPGRSFKDASRNLLMSRPPLLG